MPVDYIDHNSISYCVHVMLIRYIEQNSKLEHSFVYTVNQEIFVYENIHVLNIRVNKFSRVPHENILTRKFVKLKLLCTYRRLSDY